MANVLTLYLNVQSEGLRAARKYMIQGNMSFLTGPLRDPTFAENQSPSTGSCSIHLRGSGAEERSVRQAREQHRTKDLKLKGSPKTTKIS